MNLLGAIRNSDTMLRTSSNNISIIVIIIVIIICLRSHGFPTGSYGIPTGFLDRPTTRGYKSFVVGLSRPALSLLPRPLLIPIGVLRDSATGIQQDTDMTPTGSYGFLWVPISTMGPCGSMAGAISDHDDDDDRGDDVGDGDDDHVVGDDDDDDGGGNDGEDDGGSEAGALRASDSG